MRGDIDTAVERATLVLFREHYETRSASEPVFCNGCGSKNHESQVKWCGLVAYCPECHQPCAVCCDWLAGEPETLEDGKRVHLACAEPVPPTLILCDPISNPLPHDYVAEQSRFFPEAPHV